MEAIIEKQMHFNDLIIPFRSIVLTAFITLVRASVALRQTERIDDRQLRMIVGVPLALWLNYPRWFNSAVQTWTREPSYERG